jgi:hypothetical protein
MQDTPDGNKFYYKGESVLLQYFIKLFILKRSEQTVDLMKK